MGNDRGFKMPGLNEFFNSLTGRGVNKIDNRGETRLYKAVRSGSVNEVKKLLRAGAKPNITNKEGLSPLHQAAYWGETEIVELLLKAGASVTCDNGMGWTPLHSAALSGGLKVRKTIINLLRMAGAKDDIKDKNGWTAKDYMTLWEQNVEAAGKLKDYIGLGNTHAPEESRKMPRGPKIH